MHRLRAEGVPVWVTVIAIVLAIGGTLIGLVALVDPSAVSFSSVDDVLGRRWAGRNMGLGLATAVAVALRSRAAYLAAFTGGIFRDLGDLFASIDNNESVVVPVVAMAIGVAAIGAMVRSIATGDQARVDPAAA